MGRTPCCDKANVKKGPWSPEEDAKLKDFIEKYGTGGNWIALPQKAGLRRCGKSCRLRWLNYLRPNIKHGDFTEEEDRIICRLYDRIRTKWSVIAAHLPGRTDNDIKNYWNTKLKKKYLQASANTQNLNSNFNSFNPAPQFFTAPQIHQSQPNMPLSYRDFYTTPSNSVSLSDIHQTLPINTPYNNHYSLPQASPDQYLYNQIMPENRGIGLVFVAADHQALSSGSSGGSFMSQITQDHNMASHPQNYSSISSNTNWNAYENQENAGLDYGLMAGTITSPLVLQSYENVEEIKPVINNNNNNLSYLGFENVEKQEEREEMYY